MEKDKRRVPELRFKGFFEDWEQRKLSDILKLFGGNAFSSSDSSAVGIPWLKIANVGKDGIDWSAPSYLPNNFWKSYKDYRLCEGDYVMALTRPILNHILKIAIVDKNALLNQRVAKLIFATDSEYGYQLLQRRNVVDKIENELAGTDPPNLGSGNLKKINVSVTSNKDEQIKIGSFFKQLDNAIALHQRKVEKLTQLKRGLMQVMFPQKGEKLPKLRFANFEGEWEQRKLGNTVLITMGQSPKGINYTNNPDDNILVQGNADIRNGWVSPRVWTTQVTKIAEIGDVIISVRAPVGSVGKTQFNVVLGRGVAGVKGNEFIFQLLKLMDENGYWSKYSTGSTFESINSDVLNNAFIIIPTINSEQSKIGEALKRMDKIITVHQLKIGKLQSLKKAYLQKMFI